MTVKMNVIIVDHKILLLRLELGLENYYSLPPNVTTRSQVFLLKCRIRKSRNSLHRINTLLLWPRREFDEFVALPAHRSKTDENPQNSPSIVFRRLFQV